MQTARYCSRTFAIIVDRSARPLETNTRDYSRACAKTSDKAGIFNDTCISAAVLSRLSVYCWPTLCSPPSVPVCCCNMTFSFLPTSSTE